MSDFLSSQKSNFLPSANVYVTSGSSTSETQFNGSNGSLLTLPMEGSLVLQNRLFQVRVGGRCGSSGATNFTAKIYFGTSSTIGSNTQIATSGAIAMASANHNWFLEATLVLDVTSLKIQGIFKGAMANIAVAQAALSNAVTAVSTSSESQGFTVTGQFSATQTGDTAIVDFFEIIPL